jgi:hypothetical protein
LVVLALFCEDGEETEANGGHCGDRMLHRTRSWFDRTRLVSSSQLSDAHVLGFPTGVSGPSQNRSIRSGTQRGRARRRADRTRDASGHMQSDVFGHGGSSLARLVTCNRTCSVTVGALWTPTGRRVQRVWSNAGARPVTAMATSDAHCSRLSCSDRTRLVTLTGVSGQHVLHCVIQ